MKKIIFFLTIAFCSCSKDQAVVPDYFDPVRFPIEIQPIVKKFLSEGNKQGIYIDINKLHGIVLMGAFSGNAIEDNGYYDPNNNTIFIDTTSFCYKNQTYREALIFHELGHALLKREHKVSQFLDGYPTSIMNPMLPDYCGSTANRRVYYVEELFHSDTPAPSWSF